MFIACNQENQLVNVLDQLLDKKEKYHCPACQGKLRLKQGQIMQSHFAHVSLDDCHYMSENESAQHLELKATCYRWLKKNAKEVAIENYLPQIQQIADVWVENHLALEIQCSSLSVTRLQERTQAYHHAGYQVLWLLGKDLWLKERLTSLHKQFLSFSQNRGFHLWELDDAKKELRLRYLIHEDWHGKVQCLTQTFPFEEGDLLSILRSPYQAQALSSFEAKMDAQLSRYIAQQLFFQTPKWMILQEQAYLKGENLLEKSTEDFYPQVRPPQSDIGFSQIQADLSAYYQGFYTYYARQKNRKQQRVYSPSYYLLPKA